MALRAGRCLLLCGTGFSASTLLLAQPSLAASRGLWGFATCCRAGAWHLMLLLLVVVVLVVLVHRWLPPWQHVQLCKLWRPDEAAGCMAGAAETRAGAIRRCVVNRRQDG